VPRVRCFAVAGLVLWFNSDDHSPPHFHASRRGEFLVRVFIDATTRKCLSFEVVWTRKARNPLGKYRGQLASAVADNRAALLIEWESRVVQKGRKT